MHNDVFFNEAFGKLLLDEGGYVNDPNDAGGETKYGISKRTYPNEDIKNLTIDRAKAIYYEDFWLRARCNFFPKELGEKLFNLSVNCGIKQASIFLQRAVRAVTGVKLVEDGIIGTQTITAVGNGDSSQIVIAMRSEAAGFYRILAAKDISQEKFLEGWLNRVYS